MFGGLLSKAGGVVNQHQRTTLVIGAAILGYAFKEGWLQKIPLVGKAGPITSFGLLGWGAKEILKVQMPAIVDNAVTCALVLSAFNYTAQPGGQLLGDAAFSHPGGAVFFD